ncbi:dynamin family protein [Clostridium thermobutyricum]|uniref:dynamin family protein n=1 Tax=Clostridium thermobutyricum TaxID=29372 RepID=UPI0029427624|nr:dynamin family protein [Clostridium thermobutyricum]
MTEVFIKYNPYILKTEIKINGNEISKESSIYIKCQNNRLQYLIAKSLNWEGLLAELKKYLNEDNFKLIFHGRKIDFEDLEYTVGNDNSIILEFEKGKDDKDILDRVCEITKEIYNGPIEELKTDKIKNIGEEIKNSEFRVNVIATMSSGKSTLINSMIGKELLPSKNEACTAKISKIKNSNSIKEFKCECKDEEGKIIYKEKEVSLEDLKKYNEDEKVSILNIEGPMKEILNQKMKLVLVDTPGPNNAMDEHHRDVTNRIIEDKEKSVVIYVINATQFGINDDANLLLQISNEMSRGDKQIRDRFLFVINKCDELDVEKGETIDKLLDSVREYLSKYGIEEPNLFPLSAEMAKLIRMDKEGEKLSRKEKSFLDLYKYFIELEGLHFEKFATISPSVRRKIEARLQKAKENDDKYEEALIHTGVPAIEETLNEYLEKYAFPLKVKKTTDEFINVIAEKDMMNKLEKKINSSKEEHEKIMNQIKESRRKLENKDAINEFKFRVKKLGISTERFVRISEEIKRKCEFTFDEINEKFNDINANSKINIEDAKIYANELENEMKEISDEFETKLNIELRNEVEDKGEDILQEFIKYVNSLKADIKIEGFEITNIRKIRGLITKGIIEEMEEKKEIEDIYDIKYYRKPFKLLSPKTWGIFGGDYESRKEKVGNKEVIDIKEFTKEELTGILENVDSEVILKIDELKEKQKAQIDYYLGKIDKLETEVEKVINDMNCFINKEKNINFEIYSNKYKKEWISDINLKINKIMQL